jgi:hypothetical protein
MPLTRDLGKTLQALEERIVITNSTANQVYTSTVNVITSTLASAGISGRIIDRLGVDMLTRYRGVYPAAYLNATRGSTEADRKLTLGIKLQHGDSSGGGDMADYSTGHQPVDQTFFTSAQTTPMGSWSTGQFFAQTKQAYYDLTAAKQFIRAVVSPSKNRVTTESSGDESMRVGATLTFLGADHVPEVANSTGAGSTSTTT